MTIEFHHGALSDPYEEQANRQGFTLGDDRERLEELGYALTYCWIQDVLTDSQYDAALKKLQRQLMKALKRKGGDAMQIEPTTTAGFDKRYQ